MQQQIFIESQYKLYYEIEWDESYDMKLNESRMKL